MSTTTYPTSERQRLVKSSRKLEAMLGTTPLVLSIDLGPSFLDIEHTPKSSSIPRAPITPRTRAHRRRGQVFPGGGSTSSCSDIPDAVLPIKPKSRNRSRSEATTKKAAKSAAAPPLPTKSAKQALAQPILFRLRSVPSSLPSPTRPHTKSTSEDLRAPLSPLFNPDRASKLAKLTRTLGENVPPELVFRSPQPVPARKSDMTRAAPARPVDRPAFASLVGHHRAAASASATELPLPLGVVAPRTAASLDMPRPTPVDYVYGHARKGTEDWGKRKEREWSGEWNVKDMGDVKQKLRELKGR
ncbi:hypothetical protein DFP72DRAFT_820578 [Ephemerocybe angulata]|uniref:Uncharacterized protein n=1 Tax=Ephemerocybe angulata TaxID=980116 RepID=A0A8H6LXZ9_9AGAR|nr:hypothetical protein DFP72DRAFT_820578 [Tulosesus angulatus]